MTDNTKFKEDASALLKSVVNFRRLYMGALIEEPIQTSPSRLFESQLRAMLRIARTDEENNQQKKTDSYL